MNDKLSPSEQLKADVQRQGETQMIKKLILQERFIELLPVIEKKNPAFVENLNKSIAEEAKKLLSELDKSNQ